MIKKIRKIRLGSNIFGIGFTLVVLCLIIWISEYFIKDNPVFFRYDNLIDILIQTSVYTIIAVGMTFIIITAGIDLSVGSILGFSSVLFSLLSIQWGWSPWLAIPACFGACALCGAVSGGLIARFNIQPFIATLAMMVFARGVAKFVSGGQKISTAVLQVDGTYQYVEEPPIFDFISSRIVGENIAVVTLILLACVLVCYLILARLRWGRYLYAIGGNEEAARLSGIPVGAVKVLAYGLSGLFSGLAGICQAAQELQGDPEAGMAYELTAIAIVVIGGTSLRGGRGSIWLTLLGTMTIGYLEKILSINAVGEESRLMLTGVIIIVAVLFQKRAN